MERRLSALVLVAALSGACRVEIDDRAASQVNAASVGQEAVRRTLERYYEALSDLDSARFLGHFWPGADVSTIWQRPGADTAAVVVQPVAAFVRQWPEGPGSRSIFEERMEQAAITVAGDLAVAWVHYAARFGDPGAIDEWRGIDAFTLLRRGGEWRIVELAFVPDR